MSWWRSHSLRLSLTVWNVAAMMIVLAVYAAGVFMFVSRNASNNLNQEIRYDSQWAAAMADNTNGRLTWFEDPNNFGEDTPWLTVWNNGQIIYRSPKADRNPIPGADDLARMPTDRIISIPSTLTTFRVLTTPATIYGRRVVIQVARSETEMRRELRGLLLILMLGLPFGVGAAGFLGYTLARRALVPVERMAERAQSITVANLHDRLPVHNPTNEIGRLAGVFNDTLGRLEASFEQMRRFTADVSHELRTPLTAIRSVGEVGLREPRDERAYRGIIASMLEDVDRLATLVDRLLTWSRAETGQGRFTQEALNLHAMATEVVNHLSVLAEEKGQTLIVEHVGEPRGLGDRLVLRQSLINLVDNAIKFTPANGDIRVKVAEAPSAATIDVVDTGPGVPDELRARIFDRYNHEDRSRANDVSGAGLGLSISRSALEMNGGKLTLESTGPTGSVFRISLPRAATSRRKSVA
jgi:heavy metal sensor kinase